jgi:regulator of sigma E protease
MDFLTGFWGFGGSFFSYALPFLFVLTVVVFFHELGHFWVARRCGVKIDAFSVGFGPELIGFNDRHGTRWKLCAIPLGGYVRFFGDDSAASTPDTKTLARMDEAEKRVSFYHQPVRNRAAVVAAGPIANFILAIVIFSVIFMTFGRQVTTPRVDSVQPGSAAAEAGIQPGDMVLSIDGLKVDNFGDMQRGSGELTVTATPRRQEIKDSFGNTHRVGLLGITRSTSREEVVTERYGPIESVKLGVAETWFVVERTLSYITGIVRGTEATDQLGGPIRIAQISGAPASDRGPLGKHRIAQSFSGAAARRWASRLLRDRGHSRPAAVRARAGVWLPGRARLGPHADAVRYLERHPASHCALTVL